MAGQVWGTNTLGGYMYSLNLSKHLRMSLQTLVKFRQFADAHDATQQGKHKGDKFHWNVFSDVVTQGTTLAETVVMPETNFTISQGEITITEFGNSVPYTGKLDDLSEQPVKEIINKVLKNDAKKAFDKAVYDQFNLTPLQVAPTGGNSATAVTLTTSGTTATTNNIALNKDHVKAIVDIMKERNIPGYQGDDYFAIAHPSTFRTFKNELETIHQYVESGQTKIMNGEIGRYEGVRFIEQTNIPKETWSNNKSNWAFFFGEQLCRAA
ncbi:MAG: N4-gp56 family major capsid protein [Candidatus Moranbacteria bacterium]|nr:N4-gp56 family major capsid protein [Candidatus Moranbacteria bacterium]